MDSSEIYDVHLGFWTNWSRGRVMGGTVTLTRGNGTLLIAFIALLVGVTGKSLWRILCFALHSFLSRTASPQDGFYHQRQAILRNSDTGFGASWQLLCSIAAWRKVQKPHHILRRGIPLVAAGCVISCGFVLAGIFSSRISDSDANEVLLAGRGCGRVDMTTMSVEDYLEFSTWQYQKNAMALAYARSCYRNSSLTDNCNVYIQSRLPLLSDRNASCPFGDGLCKSEIGNLRLDTGYIDSHQDLGLNAPPQDRFSLRFTSHCAPLKTEGFNDTFTFIDRVHDNRTTPLFRLFYGRWARYTPQVEDPSYAHYANYTFQFPVNSSIKNLAGGSGYTAPTVDYALGSIGYYANSSYELTPAWEPIHQLRSPNTDVSMFFLSAPDISFMEEVDDPWFSAHTVSNRTLGSSLRDDIEKVVFQKDEPVSAVACAVQFEYCAPQTPGQQDKRCEIPHGFADEREQWNQTLSEREKNLYISLTSLVEQDIGSLSDLAIGLGSSMLDARSGLGATSQGKLPNNQWQIEMESILNAYLSKWQREIIHRITGPQLSPRPKWWMQAEKNDTGAWSICRNQKIRDPRFPSFNVFGLSFILALSLFIILLDWWLPSVVGYIHKRARKNIDEESARKGYTNGSSDTTDVKRTETDATAVHQAPNPKILKHAEWNATSTLQLQRLAHEAIHSGTWVRTSSEVPVTLPGQRLATLSFMEPPASHPYLTMRDGRDSVVGDGEPKSAGGPNFSGVKSDKAHGAMERHDEQTSDDEHIEVVPLSHADTSNLDTGAIGK